MEEEKMLAYMLTWTTHGSWVQGDRRGYVKDAKILPANPQIENHNRIIQKNPETVLNADQIEILKHAFIIESRKLNQKVFALAVCKTHVHIALENIPMKIPDVSKHYKNAGVLALRKNGFKNKLWTKGFDKRFCYDEAQLAARIEYINRHNHL